MGTPADKSPPAATKWRRVAQLQAEGMMKKERAESSPDESADWTTLSPEEAGERRRVLSALRAQLEFGASRRGYLYLNRWWIIGSLIVFALARRAGVVRQTSWAALIALLYNQRAPRLLNENPPGAMANLPFFGTIIGILEALESIAAYSLKRSRMIGFKSFSLAFPGNQRAVAIFDVRDREHVLRDNWQNYTKNIKGSEGGFDELFYEFLGRGIFVIDGAEWREARKVASHMFSFGSLRDQMQAVFHRHGMLLVDALGDLVDSGRSTIDIQEVFQSLTFDAICELAFGECPDALAQSLAGHKPDFLVSFDRVQNVLAMRGIQPPALWKFKRFLGILEEGEAAEHIQACKKYVRGIIQRRRQAKDCEERKDLLSLYMQFGKKQGLEYLGEDENLMDVVFNFMLAGRDTTSCTLTNWIKLVYSNPGTRERLMSEINTKLPGARAMVWDDVSALHQCSATFNEVIRMYPPVPVDFRMCNQDETLPSGLKVAHGDRVGIVNYAIGRDPSLWEEPDRFNIDRWLKMDPKTNDWARVRRPDEYVLPVFWAGARLCLGKDMARFEVLMVASMIMRHFTFKIKPHKELFVNGPVMFIKQGLWVEVQRV